MHTTMCSNTSLYSHAPPRENTRKNISFLENQNNIGGRPIRSGGETEDGGGAGHWRVGAVSHRRWGAPLQGRRLLVVPRPSCGASSARPRWYARPLWLCLCDPHRRLLSCVSAQGRRTLMWTRWRTGRGTRVPHRTCCPHHASSPPGWTGTASARNFPLPRLLQRSAVPLVVVWCLLTLRTNGVPISTDHVVLYDHSAGLLTASARVWWTFRVRDAFVPSVFRSDRTAALILCFVTVRCLGTIACRCWKAAMRAGLPGWRSLRRGASCPPSRRAMLTPPIRRSITPCVLASGGASSLRAHFAHIPSSPPGTGMGARGRVEACCTIWGRAQPPLYPAGCSSR
jgi:hypothetical protein